MNQTYKILKNNQVELGEFKLVPIRFEDRLAIMQWRNEQIYHLRQNKPLTVADQDAYFEQVVMKLFDQERPDQILFSYLQNDVCIGYGGLVHINWIDQHAEISFIMQTDLEKTFFEVNWSRFLELIEQVAFDDLNLHKLSTYAFDLRPHLYKVLEASGYQLEARLKEHCYFDEKFIDVLIHQKINDK